jgi:hypothetical protein
MPVLPEEMSLLRSFGQRKLQLALMKLAMNRRIQG